MKVSNVRVTAVQSDRRGIAADIHYKRSGQTETIWFEVEKKFSGALNPIGDPWAVCLAPLAALWGENIEIDAPTSRELIEQIYQINSVWRGWYPFLKPFEIVSGHGVSQAQEGNRHTGVFFSGGVDSFFTALHVPQEWNPTDLIQVWGFDIPLTNKPERDRRIQRTEELASLWSKNVVEVVTNLRTTSFRFADWGKLSHGCALAAIGHALSQRINLVLIGASYDNKALIPWGSHPVTDPLLGSRQTEIIHYGSEYRRTEKITFLAKHKIALDNMHVCYAEQSGKNCGKCEKCLRTMVALKLIHKLNEATSFPLHADPLSAYLRVSLSSRGSRIFAREIGALASQLGDTSIERQILSAITRGERIERYDRFLSPTRAFQKIFNRIRQQHPQFVPILRKIRVIVDRH